VDSPLAGKFLPTDLFACKASLLSHRSESGAFFRVTAGFAPELGSYACRFEPAPEAAAAFVAGEVELVARPGAALANVQGDVLTLPFLSAFKVSARGRGQGCQMVSFQP
jgi:hypothetical protein